MSKDNITALDRLLSRLPLVSDLMVMRGAVSNWYDLVFFRFGMKKAISARLRSGGAIRIESGEDYFRFIHVMKDWAVELARQSPLIRIGARRLSVDFMGAKTVFEFKNRLELGLTAGLAVEQFLWGEYGWLDVKGKVVVDIGGCIGDTAIYFARSGARHVYSIEPFPRSYEMAKRNVGLNNLGGEITLVNGALDGSRTGARVDVNGGVGNLIRLKDILSARGRRIAIFSLSEFIRRYRIGEAVLKIDVEGDEYGILLNADTATLRHFSMIQLEYHHGYINLKEKLERAGFSVRHTMVRYSGYDDNVHEPMYSGLLFAKRVDNA